ncbi:MAG: hypothetical protein KBD46_01520 [Candidatus Levybacteria bacterium]|nr:hypothetical protein [Candidatus Levybacteria bacterium]
MYNLTPANLPVINSIMLLFVIGILFFVVSLFVMMYMFAWTYTDIKKHGKTLTVMLLLSLSIPFTVGAMTQQTSTRSNASNLTQIENLQVNRVEEDTVVVQFTTAEPVIAYLEYKDANGQTIPVIPVGSKEPTTNHYFRVDNFKGDKGELFIIINGDKFTINGQPIQLTQ